MAADRYAALGPPQVRINAAAQGPVLEEVARPEHSPTKSAARRKHCRLINSRIGRMHAIRRNCGRSRRTAMLASNNTNSEVTPWI
jgi:hypothetical protein